MVSFNGVWGWDPGLDDASAGRLLTAIREDARTFTGPTLRRRYSRRERREKRIHAQCAYIAFLMDRRRDSIRQGDSYALGIDEQSLRWHLRRLAELTRGKR